MSAYDFNAYFDQLKAAETSEVRQAIRQREQEYVTSLPEAEQRAYQAAFEQYMKNEIVRFRRMADQAEEMFGLKRTV
jgi:hypothetical protein